LPTAFRYNDSTLEDIDEVRAVRDNAPGGPPSMSFSDRQTFSAALQVRSCTVTAVVARGLIQAVLSGRDIHQLPRRGQRYRCGVDRSGVGIPVRRDQVFLDSRSIPAGADFVDEVLGPLRTCSVLLVVIGPRWLTLTDSAGHRRLDDRWNWIRLQIAEALTGGMRVIPVLTDGGELPAEANLPQDIAGLSRRQYVPLRRRYTAVDLAFLVDQITGTDSELATLAARRQSSTGRVPQQLPAAVAHFAGRAGELATLTRMLPGRAAFMRSWCLVLPIRSRAHLGRQGPYRAPVRRRTRAVRRSCLEAPLLP
jgi:hypothetical protein